MPIEFPGFILARPSAFLIVYKDHLLVLLLQQLQTLVLPLRHTPRF